MLSVQCCLLDVTVQLLESQQLCSPAQASSRQPDQSALQQAALTGSRERRRERGERQGERGETERGQMGGVTI